MSITFSDRALARTLGTSDPTEIAALAALLNDPDSDVTLTPIDVESEEPVYVISTPDDEVERLLDRYDPRRN